MSVERLKKVDKNNNILDGHISDYISKNNIVINKCDDKIVAMIGIENMVIINTEDVILVMNKERSQDLKKMLQKLKNSDDEKYL